MAARVFRKVRHSALLQNVSDVGESVLSQTFNRTFSAKQVNAHKVMVTKTHLKKIKTQNINIRYNDRIDIFSENEN